jgi:hypothetical protein
MLPVGMDYERGTLGRDDRMQPFGKKYCPGSNAELMPRACLDHASVGEVRARARYYSMKPKG